MLEVLEANLHSYDITIVLSLTREVIEETSLITATTLAIIITLILINIPKTLDSLKEISYL